MDATGALEKLRAENAAMEAEIQKLTSGGTQSLNTSTKVRGRHLTSSDRAQAPGA